jgi:5-formyltetrahydrofolate cyclo-ligase
MDVNSPFFGDNTRKNVRQLCRDKRNALVAREQECAARSIVSKTIEHKLCIGIERVALYISQDGELDTQYLIHHLWEQNKEVYLPVLHPFCAGYLLFLRYCKNSQMTLNRFGIPEPLLDVTKVCPLDELDIIFTPLVAFDEKGNRMGMGGGFYDRTLQALHGCETSSNSPIMNAKIIGLAHDVQKTLSLPTEVWDIPLPMILTPTTLHSF